MPKALNLIGEKYGKLTVLEKAGKDKRGCWLWLCKCECGNETIVNGAKLKNGHTKSCGCGSAGNHISHGKTGTRIYRIWQAMKSRCSNTDIPAYKDYGGRGISVCKEWESDFVCFYNWAISNGYDDNLSIDRIDVNGNYEPSNCRWTTKKEQAINTRKFKLFTFNGESHTLKEWCEILNINYRTLRSRILYNGWSIERALSEGVKND